MLRIFRSARLVRFISVCGPYFMSSFFSYTFVYNNIKKNLCFYFLVLASYCKKRLLWCQYWPHWGRKENHIGTQDKVSISHKSRSSGYIRLAISFFFFYKSYYLLLLYLCKIIDSTFQFLCCLSSLVLNSKKKTKQNNEMTFNSRMCWSWTA